LLCGACVIKQEGKTPLTLAVEQGKDAMATYMIEQVKAQLTPIEPSVEEEEEEEEEEFLEVRRICFSFLFSSFFNSTLVGCTFFNQLSPTKPFRCRINALSSYCLILASNPREKHYLNT
jgi:hypothetical protein